MMWLLLIPFALACIALGWALHSAWADYKAENEAWENR